MSKFKQLLKSVDMNGAQLARRLGVSREAVSSWVKGKANPHCSKWTEIARHLNVSVDEVVKCFIE